MSTEILFYIYLLMLGASVVTGAWRYKYLDQAGKIIFGLLCYFVVSEIASRLVLKVLPTKMPVYHISCIVSLFLLSLYFLTIVKPRNKISYVIILAILLPLIGILNAIYFQPLMRLNTNTLLLRGFVITVMALYSLYRILINDEIRALNYPHFWVSALLLVLYAGTFFFWSYITVFAGKGKYLDLVQYIQATINIVVYTAIGIVFFFYPKMETYES